MQNKTINGFKLQHLLGTGGMAEVWYAENEIHKAATVKILNEDLSHNANIVERFRNEAEIMVKLDHPNIRQVYGYGSIDGRPAIVMEYLDGEDLKARMKRGQSFTDEELRRWWNQIADALNYTHEQHVVHRDIKPSNLFVDKKGNIKLLDFGIAKVRESVSMTLTGAMMGTLMYMSPEQVDDSKHIGAASDVYSLAVTFVHLLTGKAPYDRTTSSDYAIRKGIVELPLDLSGVPSDWLGFLEPYLAKKPEDRPALRPFVAVASEAPVKTDESDDEGTIVGDAPNKQEPPRQEPKKPESKPETKPETKPDSNKPKSKKGLWIGLAAALVAAIIAVLLWPGDPYKKIDNWLGESERIFETNLEATIADYSNDIAQLNIGYGYCTKASQTLNGMKDKDAEEWTSRKNRCDSLDADYVKKVSAFVENELSNLHPDQDTAAIIGRLRQLEEFNYIKMNVDNNGMMERTEKEIGLWRNPLGSANGYEWVFLGLPSGTLWATCNVGASKPEDYGSYFAWGETTTKSTFDWSTYKYANGSKDKLTKYCDKSDYGNNGFTDDLITLQSSDDAATSNWGSDWKTPTLEQWEELLQNTEGERTTKNGVAGFLFTSKKNGQSVFLPAAGYRNGSSLYSAGDNFSNYRWSSSLITDNPQCAWNSHIFTGDVTWSKYYRANGLTVRPVREE